MPGYSDKGYFCPHCGKYGAEKGQTAFVKVGNSEEVKEYDSHVHTCDGCGTKFVPIK